MTRRLVTVVLIGLCAAGCDTSRVFYYNFIGIHDHRIFASRQLEPSPVPFQFVKADTPADFPTNKIAKAEGNAVSYPLDKFLHKTGTVAFLVIRRDTILYEWYAEKYDSSSIVTSFSVTKAFLSALVGFTLQDGYIRSVDQPVTAFVPELEPGLSEVTIRHLLQMTSGIRSNDHMFNPFGQVARLYYTRDLRKLLSKLKVETAPGTRFKYASVNSQLLGLVLERALQHKTLTAYAQEKLWTPLGMEQPASWSLDKADGLEKTFCCLNATARDYARFGRLYLKGGEWEGQQLLSREWIKESTTPDTTEGGFSRYKYQWWLLSKRGDYAAIGALGQYIYVDPAKEVIIVRLGKRHGYDNWRCYLSEMGERL